MSVNKHELLGNLKADLKAAEVLKSTMDSKIAAWRDAYEGNPYGNEQKGKSAIVSKDIKRQSEWQHASIVDPFVSTQQVIKCTPITFEDVPSARQNELLLNTQFCRKFDRFNFISKAARLLDRDGTLIVQTGWDYEYEEIETTVEVVRIDEDGIEYIDVVEDTEIIVTKNQPTASICRHEDVYMDPTCMDNPDKAQFFIHRYETDLSTLRKDGRYHNLDRLAKSDSGNHDTSYTSPDTTEFSFQDEPRKKILVYEYWGNYDADGDGIAEPVVCAWVGNTIIRLGSNPYPDGKPPFLVVPFNPVPFKLHGEANAELIGDNQKVKTAIMRGVLDNMAQSNNAMVGIRKGALDATNTQRFRHGKNFEFNGSPNDFWQGSFNAIPGSAFDVLGLMNNDIESLSGIKSFSGGISGSSLGPSATAARGALDATQIRRTHTVRNISENLVKPLIRKWMAYNAEFLEDEEVVRVTNEQFVPVRKDDLSGKIDIDISVATAEDNAAKAQELSFLLQTVGPSEDPSIRRLLMADILELMRMPDKAKALREFEAQPDPFQEEMKQIELERARAEVALLYSQAESKESKSREDAADELLKRAKAIVEQNKARKFSSEADMLDLKFLMQDEDVEGKKREQEQENKRLHDLDVLAFQAMHGDTNLGVKR